MPDTSDPRSAPYLNSASDVLEALRVRKDTGLPKKEVGSRRDEHGYNELPKDETSRILRVFLDRFRDVLVIILLIAAGVSLALGHIEDAIIITVAIAIDAILSFAQVWRTEKTLDKMRERVRDAITVFRGGELNTIPARELVPGDIIEVRAGDRVPADGRLISAEGLQTQEAALTGESSDVSKQLAALETKKSVAERFNMVFAGTEVVSGTARAVITGIGTKTEFGRIAQMLREQKSPDSPLRRKLQRRGLQVGWLIIGTVVLLAGIGLVQGNSLAETARTGVTLIVSAIPEDLTMILTIALTVGVARILKKGGVVRRLSSGETLGAATVICTDKTGTLTEGKMRGVGLDLMQGTTVSPPDEPEGKYAQLALTGLGLTSEARKTTEGFVGSATARTSMEFVERFGLDQENLHRQWKTRDDIAFSSEYKYRALLADHPTQSFKTLFVAGAPDVLLERSSQSLDKHGSPDDLTSRERVRIRDRISSLAGQGSRLIGVAVRPQMNKSELAHEDVHDLVFLGVLIIEDPVRNDVVESIRDTQSAGVQIKLVTGDHAETARAVAREAGIATPEDTVMTAHDIQALSDDELRKQIDSIRIFARVEPLDKQRIVRILQEEGHVVAMTGDGVNDVVALKGADIGVAMSDGTDIARDASDLILLNNSFTTIVAAVREGRVLRDNVRKVIVFLLSTNAAEVAIFFVSVGFGMPLPLLPAQILWINLVTDGTSDIALSLEPAEDDAMKRPPEDPGDPIFGNILIRDMVVSGIIMTIAVMLLFWYLYEFQGYDLAYARTMAFTLLAVASLVSVWSFRSLTQSMRKRGLFQNKWVPISAAFSLGLHLIAIYVPGVRSFFDTVPLSVNDWIVIAIITVVTVAFIEARKLVFHRENQEAARQERKRKSSSLIGKVREVST